MHNEKPAFPRRYFQASLVTYRKLSTLWKKMDAHLSLKCTPSYYWSGERKGGSRTPTRDRCVSVLLNDSRTLHSPVGCGRSEHDRQAVFSARKALLTVWLRQSASCSWSRHHIACSVRAIRLCAPACNAAFALSENQSGAHPAWISEVTVS